jgi:hypothetical protein
MNSNKLATPTNTGLRFCFCNTTVPSLPTHYIYFILFEPFEQLKSGF